MVITLDLSGKTAVVTGESRGKGLIAARAWSAQALACSRVREDAACASSAEELMQLGGSGYAADG